MAESILRLKVSSEEYDNKLKQATNGLTRYADECRKVGGTLEVVEKETLDYVRALGQMDTTSRTATGKLAEMKKAFTELSAQYKQMTDAEKQSPFGKALAASLDQLKTRIQDSKSQLDDINKSINGGGGLTGALDAVAGKFGLSIDQVTKFGGVVGLTTTAVQVCKDAFFNSESNIDEWGRTIKGAEGAYQVFLDTLNNGNWSNFFHNLSLAIQGGRDLYDVFDRLGSIKSNNAAAIAIVQQQIAQLRLAKQQGENVDAQLKAATDRLAQLQKQSINAGKTAGTTSAFQTIRNSVNSIGGAGVNDATINYAVTRIMQNGQSEFDRYRYNRDVLRKKGSRTIITPLDDGMGGTVNKYTQQFDINLLTKEEQKQYKLAQAITERETEIQKGIAAYAQAIQEGTASAREEFKGNRYALQGAGGGGSKGGSTTTTLAPTYAADSIAAQEALVASLTKQWREASSELREGYLKDLTDAKNKLEGMKLVAPKGVDTSGSPVSISTETIIPSIDEIRDYLEKNPIKIPVEAASDKIKGIMKTASITADVVGSIGDAFNAIEDPAAKVAGTIAQAIASVALGYATATAQAGSMGPWAWVAFAATGLAEMLTMISTIHSATGYASGGIVSGNSFSGDNVPAMVGNTVVGLNAGELILNKSQQNNIASQLTQAGGAGRLVTRLKGRDILISLERELSETGKGQLATWR